MYINIKRPAPIKLKRQKLTRAIRKRLDQADADEHTRTQTHTHTQYTQRHIYSNYLNKVKCHIILINSVCSNCSKAAIPLLEDCSDDLAVVCATNCRFYWNECAMREEACTTRNPDIKVRAAAR